MENKLEQRHFVDGNGNPAGGVTKGLGLEIYFQDGPLDQVKPEGEKTAERADRGRNGAFVEDVIEAAIGRLQFFQGSRFRCLENTSALHHLRMARRALEKRTMRRTAQGVEGKYEKHRPVGCN